jgi:hypothetical protein
VHHVLGEDGRADVEGSWGRAAVFCVFGGLDFCGWGNALAALGDQGGAAGFVVADFGVA